MASNKIKAHPVEVREKCFSLVRRGASQKEVAKLTGIPFRTISAWAARFNWRTRLAVEGASTSAPTDSRQTVRVGTGLALADLQDSYSEGMATQALRLPAIMAGMSDRELIACADKVSKLDATARKALGLEAERTSVVVNVGLLAGTGDTQGLMSCPPARTLPAYEVPSLVLPTGNTPADP